MRTLPTEILGAVKPNGMLVIIVFEVAGEVDRIGGRGRRKMGAGLGMSNSEIASDLFFPSSRLCENVCRVSASDTRDSGGIWTDVGTAPVPATTRLVVIATAEPAGGATGVGACVVVKLSVRVVGLARRWWPSATSSLSPKGGSAPSSVAILFSNTHGGNTYSSSSCPSHPLA